MDALDLTAEQQPQLEDQLVSFTTISKLSNGSNSCDPVFILPYSRLFGHQEKSETLEGSGRRSKEGILDHSDGALLCGVSGESILRPRGDAAMMVAMEMTQTAGRPSSSDWRTRCLTCLLPEKPTGFDGDVSAELRAAEAVCP